MIETVVEIEEMKPLEDAFARRLVIGGLIMVTLASIVGAIYLQARGAMIPDSLTHLAATALGALGMSLATLTKSK